MILDVNQVSLHYETCGEGEPLLWLHGFGGAGSDWKYMFFPEPPAGHRLIVPDLRGHGASSTAPGCFSFRDAAADMLALLDHLSLDRVRAIGISGGGITLLHLAIAHPRRVARMVIVSAPPYFPERARRIQRQWSDAMLGEAEMVRMRERHARGASQIEALFAQARGFADSYDDVNFTPPLLSRIEAETLIVFGDRDPLYPVSIAFELHEAIPGSYLWVVPNGGHGPVFGDAAPAFRAVALPFLEDGFGRPGPAPAPRR